MIIPKIFSLNVKGLRNRDKRRKIFYLMHHWKAHIAILQETHSSKQDEMFWRSEWGGQAFFSHGETNARGVAILISKNFGCEVINKLMDDQGRIMILVLKIQNTIITIAGVYAPNQDDIQFFKKLFELVVSLNNDLKIIVGDFNTVLNVQKDLLGGRGCSNVKTRNFLNEAMLELDLVDI